ncbi:MAG: SMC family ATPase [Eubacteriaceae bacterium]|nr:SMC family ATPase [Eubacteriaceae bacterium]
MKPISMRMGAFGPYVKEAAIPFAQFGQRGVFLICGETGSGKTTVFDAICFALFGEASGSVRTTESLRSDFAPQGERTFVELEFNYKSKLYKIERSPSYKRASRRGGLTNVPAQATLFLPDGSTVAGIKEVDAKVAEILSISPKQFKQTSLIAQNEYMALLLSDSKERSAILRRIFMTEDHQQLQETLRRIEQERKRQVEHAKMGINAAYPGPIEGSQEQDAAFAARVVTELEEESAKGEADRVVLAREQKSAESKLEQLTRMALQAENDEKAFVDYDNALKRKESLDQMAAQAGLYQGMMELINKASPLIGVEAELNRAKAAFSESDGAVWQLSGKIGELDKELEKSKAENSKKAARQQHRDELAMLAAALDAEAAKHPQISIHKKQLDAIVEKQGVLNNSLKKTASYITSLEATEENARGKLKEIEGAKERLYAVSTKQQEEKILVDSLSALGKAIKESQNALEEAEKAKTEYKKAYASWDAALSKENATSSSFLAAQAGFMAQDLVGGEPCPVCGSRSHPKKAGLPEGAANAKELEGAKTKTSKAAKRLEEAGAVVASSESKLEITHSHCLELASPIFDLKEFDGSSRAVGYNSLAASVAAMAKDATGSLKASKAEASQLKKHVDEAPALERAAIQAKEEAAKAREMERNTQEELVSTFGNAHRQQASIAALSEGLLYQNEAIAKKEAKKAKVEMKAIEKSITEAEANYNSARIGLERTNALLEEAKANRDRRLAAEKTVQGRFDESLAGAGFEGLEEFLHAKEFISREEEIRAYIDNYKQEAIANESDLARLGKALSGKQRGALDGINAERVALAAAKDAITEAIQTTNLRIATAKQAIEALTEATQRLKLAEYDLAVASEMSKTANGELTGKRKVSFEQYVQSVYFDMMLESANRHLADMTDGRFELERDEDATNLRKGSSLELFVYDYYTGKSRTVKSLSGGEAFKASLSLALGMSDVIQSWAGGVEIGCVFIDEGFGTLDTQSLEQALATLESLADADRLVGVISHVDLLSERIDKKIIVEKSASGSSVSIHI